MSRPTPPSAPRRPRPLTTHGDTRVDDWYWLRSDSRNDPEVLDLLGAENAYTKAVTAEDEPLVEELFSEIRSRIKETDLGVPYRRGGWWWYSRTEEGLQYPIHCRRPAPAGGVFGGDPAAEQVLLDENVLAGQSEYFDMGVYNTSPSEDLLLYSVDYAGDEQYELRVRDLRTGNDLPDRVAATYYGTAWAGDGTFFYTRCDEAMRPYQVWRHTCGTPVDMDMCVFTEGDERFFVSVSLTLTGRFVLIHTSSKVTDEWWMLPSDRPDGTFTVIEPRCENVEYAVDHVPQAGWGDRFVIVTNAEGAVNNKVATVPVDRPGREYWTELIAHRAEVKLEDVDGFARFIVLTERTEGTLRLRVLGCSEGLCEDHLLEVPEKVSTAYPCTNEEYETTTFRFGYTSMITPSSVFSYDVATKERTLHKQTEVLGGYDPDQFVTGREWASSRDGTLVPISYVRRSQSTEDTGGPPCRPGPCLLYGYGSYEASMDPGFSSIRLSLLERGFTFAIAHVRGGGEMGRPWYEQGRLANKPNTFDDFVACGRHLVKAGYTTPSQIAARGGSAGGLLMGAVLNRAPELFACVVAEVPFVDCLTTICDPSLPLTVTEWEEWGNPLESEAIYKLMKSYSPYDNVWAAKYPPVLATSGLNDPRVSYWEPAKWVQKLRASSISDHPVLLKTEMGAGHGGPSGRYDAWRDEAFVFAFVLRWAGAAACDRKDPSTKP